MSSVCGPVHGVDLGQMALEGALSLHELVSGNGFVSLLGDSADCKNTGLATAVIWLGGTEFYRAKRDMPQQTLQRQQGDDAKRWLPEAVSANWKRTGSVCELILLPLDSVLQRLGLAARLLDARLHGLRRHVILTGRSHCDDERGRGDEIVLELFKTATDWRRRRGEGVNGRSRELAQSTTQKRSGGNKGSRRESLIRRRQGKNESPFY